VVDLNFASEEDTWRALARSIILNLLTLSALNSAELLEQVPIKSSSLPLLPVGIEEDLMTAWIELVWPGRSGNVCQDEFEVSLSPMGRGGSLKASVSSPLDPDGQQMVMKDELIGTFPAARA